MSQKSGTRSKKPDKSVLSKECQRLLEEIFAFFKNREKAKKDPDLCLEAILSVVQRDLVEDPISSMLQLTLDMACTPTAAEYIREEKRSGEFYRPKIGERLEKERRAG